MPNEYAYNFSRLTDAQKTEMRATLLACVSIEDSNSRNAIIQRLPSRVRGSINRGTSAVLDVQNIVTACVNYPGAVEVLVDAVRSFDGGTWQMEEIDRLLDRLTHQPVSWGRIAALKALIVPVPSNEALRQYARASIPSTLVLPTVSDDQDLLSCLLQWMARIGLLTSGNAPLLSFVKRIAANALSNRTSINEWITATAESLGLSLEEIGRLQSPPGRPTDAEIISRLYLLIELEPKVEDRGQLNARYIVRAWLFGVPDQPRYIPAPDETYTRMTLPALVQHWLDNDLLSDRVAVNNALTIEFLLPTDLLDDSFDQWDPDDDMPLGSQYQVVVRSRERARQMKYWPYWTRHWARVNLLQVPAPGAIQWWSRAHMAEEEWRRLRADLECDVICLALTHPPLTVQCAKKDLLLTMLRAGTPIALWCRDNSYSAAMLDQFETLLAQGTLGDIPEFVRELRAQAWKENTDSVGKHLTLLWDDWERKPPDPQQFGSE